MSLIFVTNISHCISCLVLLGTLGMAPLIIQNQNKHVKSNINEA